MIMFRIRLLPVRTLDRITEDDKRSVLYDPHNPLAARRVIPLSPRGLEPVGIAHSFFAGSSYVYDRIEFSREGTG